MGTLVPVSLSQPQFKCWKNIQRFVFLFFGDHNAIQQYLPQIDKSLSQRIIVHHCDRQIFSDTSITQALRYSKGTSLRLAIEAVQKNSAAACVSAGNTGALMGYQRF